MTASVKTFRKYNDYFVKVWVVIFSLSLLLYQDEAGSKSSGRGDSARSKGTTDSGVMMENRDHLVLPGGLPNKIPPLPSESLMECVAPNGEFHLQTS